MKYRILFKDKVDKDTLEEIKEVHSKDMEGIGELYNLLIENSTFDTYEAKKAYYVAYTLALKDIELIIVRVN